MRRYVMPKRTIFGIAAGIILLVGWWSSHRHGGSSNQARSSGRNPAGGAPVPVVAGKAEQKDVPIYLDGLGAVRAGRGSVSTHLIFSAVCVRGHVVIASRALPEIPTAAHFNNSLVFLPFTDGRNDDCTYDG